jgi:hypothetical protein
MEKMGKEINPNKMPIEDDDLPLEVQQSLAIHSYLPDRWDGSSGSYMGKDWSALTELLDSYNIEDRRTVIFFLKVIDNFKQNSVNESLEKDRKKQEAKIKAPVGYHPKSET